MFEIYNVNNKIPEKRYLEMNDILQKDYINRRGIDEFEKRREEFEGDGFEHWKSMILNDPSYNIILYIVDDKIAGFVCYIPIDSKLLLSEVQIIKEFQGKNNTLRKILKRLIEEVKNKNFEIVSGSIAKDNDKSRGVFSHIGMVNTRKNWFEMSFSDLEKWVHKE